MKRNVRSETVASEQKQEQGIVDERPELRPTVELRTQAKIDSEAIAKVDGTGELDHPYGLTLEAQERWEAREAEIARTHERQKVQTSQRERRTRVTVEHGAVERSRRFRERAASVDPAFEPGDARAALTREELAAVNQQAARITAKVRESGTRAAVSRRLAEEVRSGKGLMSASLRVLEAEQTRAGTVVPIGMLEEVSRKEVTVEATVSQLWQPSNSKIAQVGLLEDESGRVKVTVWKASDAPWMDEGERVRIRAAAKNWYNGRVSVAVTGWSDVSFPERGRWWEG
ncbi:OB-fold nucleic acid binding domain-containing protein [Halobaculum limi]|uniref:OB-fold nucleic acid binding domain-containing protein n=1 Tax=Halobaculum limi TaxID=3031916 RepID=UPI0024071324|nr:OB-fold nucleic acid binding domain-containing protein [Halobaculum sp. YSMS11]